MAGAMVRRRRAASLMSKSAFARHEGVTPAAVTNWIARGKLSGAALALRLQKERLALEEARRRAAREKAELVDAAEAERCFAHELEELLGAIDHGSPNCRASSR